jgi:hypothetical protein
VAYQKKCKKALMKENMPDFIAQAEETRTSA